MVQQDRGDFYTLATYCNLNNRGVQLIWKLALLCWAAQPNHLILSCASSCVTPASRRADIHVPLRQTCHYCGDLAVQTG